MNTGAELVAISDLAYFGVRARRDSIIPILVANPGPAEIEEGKGAEVPGLDLSQTDQDSIMATLLARRLQDGDVAVERYDLSTERDQARAVALLELIVPPGRSGTTTVWLWVNGELDPNRKLRGEGPLAYMDGFRDRLETANIDLGRVRMVAKPVVDLPAEDSQVVLDQAISAHLEYDLPVSVTLDSEALLAVVSP